MERLSYYISITLNNEFYQIELNEMVMVDNGCYTLTDNCIRGNWHF
jgi:hypothetical protein